MDFIRTKFFYQDTDSLYIHMDLYEKTKEAGYVGKTFGQGKNAYGDSRIFYGLFLAPKMKVSFTKKNKK